MLSGKNYFLHMLLKQAAFNVMIAGCNDEKVPATPVNIAFWERIVEETGYEGKVIHYTENNTKFFVNDSVVAKYFVDNFYKIFNAESEYLMRREHAKVLNRT